MHERSLGTWEAKIGETYLMMLAPLASIISIMRGSRFSFCQAFRLPKSIGPGLMGFLGSEPCHLCFAYAGFDLAT